MAKSDTAFPNKCRHGCVRHITPTQAEQLQKQFPSQQTISFHPASDDTGLGGGALAEDSEDEMVDGYERPQRFYPSI